MAGIILAVAGWFLLFRPGFLGGSAGYVIVSGKSMEPALRSGDLVITRATSGYVVGDVVAFHIEAGTVIHRIVGGSAASGFDLQGDNNGWVDEWHPSNEDIIGKQWIHLPGKGRWLEWAREPQNLAAIAGGMAAMTLVGSQQVKTRFKRRRAGHMRHEPSGRSNSGMGPERLPAPLWAWAGLGVAALTALAFGAFAVKAFTSDVERTTFEARASYQQSGSFDYTIFAQPSTLYPSGVIGPVAAPPVVNGVAQDLEVAPVYTKLVKGIEVGYRYSASGVQIAPGGGFAMNLLVKATGEGGWSKSFELIAPSAVDGTETSGRAYIDLAPLQALIETIEKETGYTAGAYELVVTPRVEARGTVAGEAVELLFSPALTFKYTKTLITPDSRLQHLEPKTLGDNVTRAQDLSAGALTLPVSMSRGLFGGLTIASLAAAAAFASVVFLGLGQPESVKAQVRYGATLVQVSEADHNGSHRVRVASMTDLARLAQRDGGVIFSQKLPDGDLYFIPDGPVTYEYGSGVVSDYSAAAPSNPKGAKLFPPEPPRRRRSADASRPKERE
jgi:signal peptidase I